MQENRKIRYTKRALRESLVELLESKKISEITVKELCDQADINRTTFYSHYDDMDAFIEEVENEIVAAMPTTLGNDVDIKLFLKKQIAFTSENFSLINALAERGKLFDKLNDMSMIQWESSSKRDEKQKEIFTVLSSFFTTGFYKTILLWMDKCRYISIDELVSMIASIFESVTAIRREIE